MTVNIPSIKSTRQEGRLSPRYALSARSGRRRRERNAAGGQQHHRIERHGLLSCCRGHYLLDVHPRGTRIW
jgi:hypothetical protein